MAEQSKSWNKKGFKAVALTDDAIKEDPNIYTKIGRGHYNLIYVSLERTLAKKGPLWLLLKDSIEFRSLIRYVIIDEAHLMITWGSSFRPEYANIGTIRHILDGLFFDGRPDGRRTPLGVLTATASPERLRAIMGIMNIKANDCVRTYHGIHKSSKYLLCCS
jgi:superfamily II DNA helicase RecQ